MAEKGRFSKPPEKRREEMTHADKMHNVRKDTTTQRNWVDACLDCTGLTDWEANFIASIAEALDNSIKLTDRQIEILERIYSEKA